MRRSMIGFFGSGIIWFMIFFPLGIMYTVQSNGDSKLVKFIATLKAIWDFI